MSEHAFISIGSNLEPERYLPLAVRGLRRIGRLVGISGVHQSPAVGSQRGPDFLNAAVRVETEASPLDVRQRLRDIEVDLGREREEDKFAPRTIDLDLCLYGSLVLSSPQVTLPHPELIEQAYVAVPMAQLAPDLPHPITGETLRSLANRLALQVELVERSDVALTLEADREV